MSWQGNWTGWPPGSKYNTDSGLSGIYVASSSFEKFSRNKSEALAQISKGEGGFKDRDLYPFCGNSEGNFTAHPVLNGRSLKGLMDKSGKPLGEEIYAVAKEGEITEVSYLWPRPGSSVPVPKVSFVTKVGDQVCAVGYYK